MAKQQNRFSLTPELGRKLREFRVRAGLTQQELAGLMGRHGKGGHTIVGNLELARTRNPTIGLIADFLRACRAGFSELAPFLDRYTSRPTIAEQEGRAAVRQIERQLPDQAARAVENYDVKTAVRRRLDRRKPESVKERTVRAQHIADAFVRRRKLRVLLGRSMTRANIGTGPDEVVGKELSDHGFKLWGILTRTRRSRPERRQKLLDEADAWLMGQNVVPEKAVHHVRNLVVAAFTEMNESSEPDRRP